MHLKNILCIPCSQIVIFRKFPNQSYLSTYYPLVLQLTLTSFYWYFFDLLSIFRHAFFGRVIWNYFCFVRFTAEKESILKSLPFVTLFQDFFCYFMCFISGLWIMLFASAWIENWPITISWRKNTPFLRNSNTFLMVLLE